MITDNLKLYMVDYSILSVWDIRASSIQEWRQDRYFMTLSQTNFPNVMSEDLD